METGNVGHHNVAWELNDDPRFDQREGALVDLAAELAQCRSEIAIVSSEDFEYLHARPHALTRIKQALKAAGFDVFPLVYLRSRREYAISLYAELLKHGLTCSIGEFFDTILEQGAIRFRDRWIFQFRYSVLLDPLVDVFGRERTMVRRYVSSKNDAYLAYDVLAVFRRFGSSATIGEIRIPPRLNRSPPIRTPRIPDFATHFAQDIAEVERAYCTII